MWLGDERDSYTKVGIIVQVMKVVLGEITVSELGGWLERLIEHEYPKFGPSGDIVDLAMDVRLLVGEAGRGDDRLHGSIDGELVRLLRSRKAGEDVAGVI